VGAKAKTRCRWAGSDPLYVRYHDEDWGVPVRRDRKLFEMLILEGAQAGLSWLTILRRREGYRAAFDRFDPQVVARYDKRRIERLLRDERIVRNRAKVESTVSNARVFLEIRREFGTFGKFLWPYVDGEPRINRWRTVEKIPAATEESHALSRELRDRGMRFVGPTICYAYMQSVGLVNDHVTSCFRYTELGGTRARR